MDAYIDARFERLETALVRLTESIAKYTPQPSAGHELLAADRALADGLRLLQQHQSNHALLASLRATSGSLDAQVRDTLRLLWTTRRDISGTPVTTFPDGPRYDVNWEELLGYARRISKTTMPAPSILSAAAAAAAAAAGGAGEDSGASTGEAAGTPNTTAAQTPAPGGATPAGANGAARSPPPAGQQVAVQVQQQAPNGTALPEVWDRFLDPLTDTTFQPWPTEDKIRGGALASLEELMVQGIDPRGFDPAEEEARRLREEEERRVQEEKEAREREENLRKMREEQARITRERQQERERAQQEAMRRGSMGGPAFGAGGGPSPTTGAPARNQFQFMNLDDDDDD